ncbi:phosphoglycerate dehydrogenase [uncultured Desulfobacter sp.]|uniref:phosphoglycerate dehydrogenase n=1 Tax=uncultured Desulfobacter sp. TaxID=240139 RepID=UPI002AABB33D|nr:phosphoglycerate dehydrogenase [uncultured Desulfobacter sp.]
MPKIFVSTSPFGEIDPEPLRLLEKTGWEFQINSLERKLTAEEVGEMAADCEGLIAGTEDINIVLEKAKKLKIISRVGIGLDSVPLKKCQDIGIVVTYTPDAVTMAVAELTVGIMISLTRHVCYADRQIRQRFWKRRQGKRIGKSVIGIIGFGRVGTSTVKLLASFQPDEILVNDIIDKTQDIAIFKKQGLNIRFAGKEEIYRRADVVSLHVPLTSATYNMINRTTLSQCKPDAYLMNLSRGGIVNETDLLYALENNLLAGAAIDCFEEEPYHGPLSSLDNVILTQHMGSCSYDCRAAMEIEATKDMIRFFKGEPLLNPVTPSDELM